VDPQATQPDQLQQFMATYGPYAGIGLFAAGAIVRGYLPAVLAGVSRVWGAISGAITCIYTDVFLDGYKRWQSRRQEIHAIQVRKDSLRIARLEADTKNATLAQEMAHQYIRSTSESRPGITAQLPAGSNGGHTQLVDGTPGTVGQAIEQAQLERAR